MTLPGKSYNFFSFSKIIYHANLCKESNSTLHTILKNGKVFSSGKLQNADLVFANGKIIYIGKQTKKFEKDAKTLNVKGQIILPGVIDAHVHFRTPGQDWKETFTTGSMAAAAGGVTTVLDMPNNNPPIISLKSLNEKRKIVKNTSQVNYGFYIGATSSNTDEILKCKNIAGVKIYMGSSTGDLLVEDQSFLERIFKKLRGVLIAVHAENNDIIRKNEKKFSNNKDASIHSKIRNCECAHVAVSEAIKLAKKNKSTLHICHVSSADELLQIAKAKKQFKLTCEVTPHHLFLNTTAYKKLKNFAKVNPPLRNKKDNIALLNGLKKNVIDIVATDHAPHTNAEKRKSYDKAPSGVPNIENSLSLMLTAVYNKKITLGKLVEVMCENPAKLFNIKNKGELAKGYDADIVIVDTKKEKIISDKNQITKCKWSPFKGMKLRGVVTHTFVNGELVFNGKSMKNFPGREVNLETR